jgi:hypothetical protein
VRGGAGEIQYNRQTLRSANAAAFQLTIAIGAFLLFLVEPMAARFLLPWFGGSPSVWSTCLLFFQAALLAGYVYAHLTRKLGPARQARVHLVLLVAAIVTLPIIPSPSWKPADPSHPAGRILLLLSATVGLPYVLLAATAPMVQDWFARLTVRHYEGESTGRAVYWLYALSNLGSLLGLLAYPAAIERLLSIRAQGWLWSAGFVFFCGVCAWTATQVWRLPAPAVDPAASLVDDVPVRAADWAMWILLSLTGTGLLLAITNELCQNVAVVPLLWIVPLIVYLLTFILCFSGQYRRAVFMWVLLAALGALVWMTRAGSAPDYPIQVATLIAVLFGGCMVCHGELVNIRPAPRHLTAFYLAVAAGGSIGGVAVALVAPLVFDRLWEYPIFTLLPLLLLIVAIARDAQSRLRRGVWRLGWVVLLLALGASTYELTKPPVSDGSTEVARKRNFYGVLTVLDDNPDTPPVLRRLRNGTILHGAQFLDPAHKMDVTTYYGDGSGVEIAIDQHPKREAEQPMSIGVIGLGAGTIAGLGQDGDTVHFYEINPAAADFAQHYFTFLGGSKARVEIALGDARLSLERELRDPSRHHVYDVMAIDAFSGDAIPVHLLTREAFALYREALREDGVLAVHVSNHYLDLPPIVRGLAAEQGRQVVMIETTDDESRALDSSTWMLVTNNAALLENAEPYVTKPEGLVRTLVWTDAFSSLLQVLK